MPPPAVLNITNSTNTTSTKTGNPKRISNPRRLLLLTPSHQSIENIPPFLQSLTGAAVSSPPPPPPSQQQQQPQQSTCETPSFAGYTTHAPLSLSNKYYSADIPIWVDEIPTTIASNTTTTTTTTTTESSSEKEITAEWKDTFLSDEAREVRDAVGAVVLCVRNPAVAYSKAVPREAIKLVDSHAAAVAVDTVEPGDAKMETVLEREREREDVQMIKKLVGIVNELKEKIENERNGLIGGDDDGDMEITAGVDVQDSAEVPGLLVLIDGSRSLSSRTKKGGGGSGENPLLDEMDADNEPFTSTWWEDTLYDDGVWGMEIIQWNPATNSSTESRNAFGELEGLPRIKEVLSTHQWAQFDMEDDDDDETGFDDDVLSFLNRATDDENKGFRLEVNQLEREMMGLKFAINSHHDESQEEENADTEMEVENLEALMMRMRAIKEISADLPESKRTAFAAKAVKDLMREL